ncbi:MAG: pilin, partial [Candidatus Portnoybacteria bacterium]|nr:pilin [Candidatus Portnoybacteria bacterium]
MKLRNCLGAWALALLCLAGAGFAMPARAQINTGLNEVGQTIKLSGEDPRILASRIINVVLGVIGIILLTLVLYAGFVWMTAGGDADKISKAQKILRNAFIGLIIILAAWAITYYVINVLLNATGGGGGGGGGSGGGGGGGGFGGGGSKAFRIASASPQGDDKNPYNTNSKINITFTQEISPDIPKDWAKYVQVTKGGSPVNGTWEIVNSNAQWIRFTPGAACPEDPNQKCFDKNTLFTVTVNKGTFISAAKETLNCSGLYPSCDFKFYIGDKMDNQAPTVTITDVYDYESFCEDVPYVSIPAKAEDDVGVSVMQWLEDGTLWDSDGPSGQPTPKMWSASKDWSTVGKVLKQFYAVEVSATDLDSNIGSKTVHLTVLKNHCCNKKNDADETGVDCGGKDCL